MVVGIFVGLLLIALAIPPILKKAPPNFLYGFRTSKTLPSETIWYEANRVAGWDLLLAGAVILVFSLLTGKLNLIVLLLSLAAAIGHSFWVLRRL